MRQISFALLTIVLLLVLISCSSGNNPITTILELEYNSFPVIVTDCSANGTISGGMGALGLFQLYLNSTELSAELISLRKNSLTDVLEVVDIMNFMTIAPCTDCAKINSVGLDSDQNIVVSIGIKHPFPTGDSFKPVTGRNRADLHVFNVEGIVISKSAGQYFPMIGRTTIPFLLNTDGYTGYLDESIDSFYPTSANIHPYILHFDDYSAGNFSATNPMGFLSVTNPPPSGNLVMAMGSDYDFKDYVFSINGSMEFIYAVGCTYGVSADSKNQRFSPEYRVPQHNKKAASEVWVEVIENNLAEGNTSSSATIRVNVVDISHGVLVGSALNQMEYNSSVVSVRAEVPGVTASPVVISFISGTGRSPLSPLIYEGSIFNTNSGNEGTYTGLIKVSDSYMPGLNSELSGDGIKRVPPDTNPNTGIFPISEFAIYQVFSITVAPAIQVPQITIIIPNGGEEWKVGSDEEITWASQYIIGTVFIEYSKDNFISDIHTIAIGETNDNSFQWNPIPNDPSSTVRVRVSSTDDPSVNDVSNGNFSIVTMEVILPNGGEEWKAGSNKEITWASQYVTGTVFIEYSKDNFLSDIHTIVVSKVNDGSFMWQNIPCDIFNTVRVRVSSTNNPSVNDVSDGNFSIIAPGWAKTWGGSSRDHGMSVAIDNLGNTYVTGHFQGTVDFDPGAGVDWHTSSGSSDVFLSKFNPCGEFLWAEIWGEGSADFGYGVAIDESGNIYITGQSFTNSGYPHTAAFLKKFDSSGNCLWTLRWADNVQPAQGHGVVCSSGNIYVTGAFSGYVDFDPGTGENYQFIAGSGNNVFLSKFDSSGNFFWAKIWGGSSEDRGYSVVSDGAGNIYVAGAFRGTVDFDPDLVDEDPHTSINGYWDVFLSKFDSSGDFLWARTWGSGYTYSSSNEGWFVAIDVSGNIYVAGPFKGTVDFDPGSGVDWHTSSGDYDVFLSKFDSSGDFFWVNTWGGSLSDYGYGVAVDVSDNIYVTGGFQGTVDFDSGTGVDWHTSSGSSDVFLSKFNSSGSFLWVNTWGDLAYDYGRGIAVDMLSGDICVTGIFSGTVDFNPGTGVDNHVSNGDWDVFLSKFLPDGSW